MALRVGHLLYLTWTAVSRRYPCPFRPSELRNILLRTPAFVCSSLQIFLSSASLGGDQQFSGPPDMFELVRTLAEDIP